MNASPELPRLPEWSDRRVDEIERTIFARIHEERRKTQRRRGRVRLGGAAAAAIVVVAALISPAVVSSLSTGGSAGSTVAGSTADESGVAPPTGGAESLDSATGSGSEDSEASAAAEGTREITTTASASVTVPDVSEAARQIGADAERRGGYVESLVVADDAAVNGTAPDSADGVMIEPYPYPVPVPTGGGSITVRVPSAELDAALASLAAIGEVTASNLSRQDVTDQAVDLRARVAASEASVARLTQLIAQASSVGDLIAAESALAERQASLDSDRRQLEWLETQVTLSTLSVQLAPVTETVEADPAGFGDGIAAGWNGLVATLNGVVIALGFLLPWMVAAAAAGAIVWAVVRLSRRRRRSAGSSGSDAALSTRAATGKAASNVGGMNADDKTRIAAGESDQLPPAPHGLGEEEAVRKDRTYSPASETETAQKQDSGVADTVDADIDRDQVQVSPGTGGPDDVGDVEVDPDDLNMPGRS